MAIATGRPAQKTQKPRKGKKSWRKNIDLDDIEQGLDGQREEEIVLGPKNEALFTLDKTGSDVGLTSAMKGERRLESHKILYERSAVPAVVAQHKKKDKPKTKVMKNRKALLERAGFTEKSSAVAHLERDGVLKSGSVLDLWGSDAPAATNPLTYKLRDPEAPIPGSVAVTLPDAGQSYNPALDDWKASILAEYKKIEKEEEQQAKNEQTQARIDAIITETEARLAEDDGSEEQDANEDIDSNERISINSPAALKRKTRAQRNKERRHKHWIYELSQLKQKKQFIQNLAENVKKHLEKKTTDFASVPAKRKLKAHSGHSVMPEPLAVKLSDELDDSLRRLKPEGSLIKERLRSFQARGLVEARVPIKKRKSRSKMVEKHSFKHFQ